MPRFNIRFDDGSERVVDADNGDIAKAKAKQEAKNESGATLRSDPRVKVACVTRLD